MKQKLQFLVDSKHWKKAGFGVFAMFLFPLFTFGTNLDDLSITVVLQAQAPMCGGFATGSITALPTGGSGTYFYNWSNGANTQTINLLPAGTYAVTVTDNGGNSAISSITLNEPPPLTATISATCSNPGNMTAYPAGGVTPYMYMWSTGATSQTIFNLSPGQYCVTIMDANMCGIVKCASVGSGPVLNVTTANAGCNGGNNGSATANVSGSAPFTYQWSNGGNTQTINNLGAGTYTVTVTDNNGCTSSASGVVTASNGSFPIWLSATPPSSCAAFNGSITAVAMGGIAPFQYNWSNGGVGATITNLGPGTYTVTVTDGVGCTSTKSTTLSTPNSVTIWASATPVSCPGANDGTATASGSGGVQPYTFQWSNGATGNLITNLSPGNYTVTVTDFAGCTASTTVNVGGASTFTINVNSTNVTSCGGSNGSASANAIGGNFPFTYQWSNGGNTQTISGLSSGFYTVTVTDGNGCTSTGSAWITEPPNLSVSISATPVICSNSNSGMASAFINGGTAPFIYQWSNGSNAQTISNLSPGTYSVTVTDINGCVGAATTTISSNDFVLDVITQNVLCYGQATGLIDVTGWNGTPPYTYIWNTGSTNNVLSNILAGTYSVTVTDAGGCTLSQTITLTQPPQLNINMTVINPPCTGGTGSATANVIGGTPAYSYQWNFGAITPTVTGLIPGTYTVTVTDDHDCTAVSAVTIVQPPPLSVNVTGTNILCNGGNNGSATANVIGGTAPFNYQWSNGATTQSIFNLTGGAYTVTVTDANGCSGTGNIWLSQPSNLSVSVSASAQVCNDANDGMATATPSGGTAPYTYFWNTGATTQTIAGLPGGTYSVTVTDANGCTAAGSASIIQIDLTIDEAHQDVICFGQNNGSILVSGWGGTMPYTYIWNTGATTPELMNLGPGTYTVTVTDATGCSTVEMVTIQEPPQLSVNITTTGNNNCVPGNATATANVTGGTPPYTYTWNTGATSQTITNLSPGTYQVQVMDANFCTEVVSITITAPPLLTVTINSNNVTCYGGNNGSASAVATGGTPPYSYQWTTGSTNSSISNLTPGFYMVTVTDGNGCTGSANVNITEPAQIIANVSSTNAQCGTNSGSATANVTAGGIAPFSYNWSNGQTTQTISNLAPGTYTVTITDATNCTAVAAGTVGGGTNVIVNISSGNVNCNGGNNGFAMAIVTSGTMPFTYNWSNGATSSTITNLTAGNYSVTVTDANGCTDTDNVTISQPSAISLNVNSTNETCGGSNNGTANAMAFGGTPPFSYSWSNGQASQMIFNLSPGTYFVTATDSNGCTATGSTTVSPGGNLTVNINAQNLTCAGANNGSAMALGTGGTPPYSYLWSTGMTSQTIAGLTAGQYFVTVTDNAGCTGTAATTITEPDPIEISFSITDPSCAGSNDGKVTAFANGGTAPYSYQWSNGGNTQTISNLVAGTYTVTVTDANGCTNTGSATLEDPPAVSVSASSSNPNCAGGNNGTASATPGGGTPPFIYQWSNGQSGQNIFNLTAGSYTVTMTDANGCTATASTSLQNPPAMNVSVTGTNPSCGNGNDGSASANVTGGVGPFNYQWSNGGIGQNIVNLTAGTYTVTVTDANNCTTTGSATLQNPPAVNVTASASSPSCSSGNNGTVSASASGGNAPYIFMWSNGAVGANIGNLAPGTYTVTATDANGCTGTGSATVIASPSLSCIAVVTQEISVPFGNDGQATVTVTGGTPGFSYNWSNGGNTQTITNLTAGGYWVTVTDANGCTTTCNVTLQNPQGPCENVTDPGEVCCDQTLCGPGNDPAPITEIFPASGGSGAIEYLWMFTTIPGPFNPNTWTTIPTATGASYDPGPIYETTFFVRCVRREGCTSYLESNIITITVDLVANAQITGPTSTCVGDENDYAAANSGAGATYSWNFGTGASPQTANTQFVNDVVWNTWGLKTVTLTVTRNGCTSYAEIEVFVSDDPVFCGNAFIIDVTALSQDVVAIDWDLAYTGNDSLRFIIERSADFENFDPIGEVERIFAGNTTTHYQFFDQAPKKGRSFYRVRLENIAGEFRHSNTEEVLLTQGISLVHLYPNPVKDALYVELIQDFGNAVEFEIFTANGVRLDTIKVPDEAIRVEMDFSNYANGVYFFVVKYAGEDQKVIRVVKI